MIIKENCVLIDFDLEEHEIKNIKSFMPLYKMKDELSKYITQIGTDNQFTILTGINFFSISMWFELNNTYQNAVSLVAKEIENFIFFMSLFNHRPALWQGDPSRIIRDDFSARIRDNKYLCASSYGYRFIIEKGE